MEQILSEGWNLSPEHVETIQNNVWKVHTSQGIFSLKESELKEKNLDFICRAEHSLVRHGFRNFALPQRCRNGTLYHQTEQSCFTLHQWIDGEKCDFQNTEHLFKAASTLGNFHLRSREPQLRTTSLSRCNCFIRGEQMEKHIAELYRFYREANNAPMGSFQQQYAEHFPYFIQKAKLAHQLLQNSDYPRLASEATAVGSFIHYDVAARNFIIQKDGAYLIDFDYCCCDLPLTDLMRLIKRGMKQSGYEEEKISMILHGYGQYRNLTDKEAQVLFALILFPQKFWRISHRFFCEANLHDESFCLKKLDSALEESRHEDHWFPILKEMLEVTH